MTSPNTIIADMQAEIDALRDERDELVVALETIIANDGGEGSKCFDASSLFYARLFAKSVIASVKGVQ